MYWLYVDPYKEIILLLQRILNRPIVAILVCIATIFCIFWVERLLRRSGMLIRCVSGAIAASLLLYFCITAIWYLFTPAYLDHCEAYVPILAKVFGNGQPLYHAIEAAERYSLPYGPVIFLSSPFFFHVSTDNLIFFSKLTGVVAGISSIVLILYICLKKFGFFCASLQTCFLIQCCLWFGHYSYWNKAEPLLLFTLSCGACALLLRHRILTPVVLCIAFAVAINLKIHTPLYFIPFLAALLLYHGLRPFVLCIAGSALLSVLPFLNNTACQLENYIQWIGIFSTHPLSLFVFTLNINHVLLLFVPVMLIVWTNLPQHSSGCRPMDTQQTLIILSGLCAMLLVCVVASKEGAGPHHLLPFAPFIVFIIGFLAPIPKSTERFSVRGLITGMLIVFFTVAALLTAYKNQKLVWPFLRSNPAAEVVADINCIKDRYRGLNIQMGYGGDESYSLTWYRPLLLDVMHGYLLDAPAIMDMKKAGLAIPQATCNALIGPDYELWLIPKNDIPFSMHTLYLPFSELFGHEFQACFLSHYTKVEDSRFYSVWLANRLIAKIP